MRVFDEQFRLRGSVNGRRLPLRPNRAALRASQASAPTAPQLPQIKASTTPELVYFLSAGVV